MRMIWLESRVLDRLRAMRGPGESYSDVILRLVEIERGGGHNTVACAPKRRAALNQP